MAGFNSGRVTQPENCRWQVSVSTTYLTRSADADPVGRGSPRQLSIRVEQYARQLAMADAASTWRGGTNKKRHKSALADEGNKVCLTRSDLIGT